MEGKTVFRLRYCTYYDAVGFTADRNHYDGVWVVKEGYTSTADPTLVTGVLRCSARTAPRTRSWSKPRVAVQGGGAAIKTGDGSRYFEPGEMPPRTPGQATGAHLRDLGARLTRRRWRRLGACTLTNLAS